MHLSVEYFPFYFSTKVKPRNSAASISVKRSESMTHKDDNTAEKFVYNSFKECKTRISMLKLSSDWKIQDKNENFISAFFNDINHSIPKFEIYIINNLDFIIRLYSWTLPVQHEIYEQSNSSMKYISFSNLVSKLASYNICTGVSIDLCSKKLKKHCIPQTFNPLSPKSDQTEYNRSPSCILLVKNSHSCKQCNRLENSLRSSFKKDTKRKLKSDLEPAKNKAPISLTSPKKVLLTLQNYRLENKQLKADIEKMKIEIEKSSVNITQDLNDDFKYVMSQNESKMTPFMKLFWSEQQKYLSSTTSRNVRYHPMIIRYCLALASKSPAAYEQLRYDESSGTGVLVLPSRRRLQDYKNYITPQRGFNPLIVKELKNKVKEFSDIEKYIVLLFDEIKIQEQLVWDKHTGELIGYVDLGDVDVNYSSLNKVDELATHMLVFMVRSLVNPIKFSFANFATTGATSSKIFTLFWSAVSILELQCTLKVIATTSDGASPNRKFFRMNEIFNEPTDEKRGVTYKVKNMFADRYIYFIADPPHLIKTGRNCLTHSGHGRCTRYMRNNGFYLLWDHIRSIYDEDRECGLHLLPRLKYEHVNLTPYSVMNVRLAAQVLSSTVSNVLSAYGPPEAAGTAKYCMMMDTFFDILNIRNSKESEHKRKPFLEPFTSINDHRFQWLEETFLSYFESWQQSITTRPGNFTQNAKNNMFISWQTYEGIKITTQSIIEIVKYLLQNGFQYVFTEHFCQDPLENYFGRQRSSCGYGDNPNSKLSGYNDNAIRNSKIFRPIRHGNSVDITNMEIDEEPVPCRKRKK